MSWAFQILSLSASGLSVGSRGLRRCGGVTSKFGTMGGRWDFLALIKPDVW